MAQGRFLSKSIAYSLQLAHLPPLAELLFYRCLPHLDREGRMSGEYLVVKAIAAPIRDVFTVESIEKCLSELENAALVTRYHAGGSWRMAFPGFRNHQKGMRLERESKSIHPAPPKVSKTGDSPPIGGVSPENSGPDRTGPAESASMREYGSQSRSEVEVKGEVEVLPHRKHRNGPRVDSPAPGRDDTVGQCQAVWEQHVGLVNRDVFRDHLEPVVLKYGGDATLRAITYYVTHPDPDKPSFRSLPRFVAQAAYCVSMTSPMSAEELRNELAKS